MSDIPTPERLTQEDVDRLMKDASPRTRARTSAKIASQFDAHELSAAERKLAEEIFRLLIKDTEVLVRESLSAHLNSTPDLPHDVAIALAQDVNSVALPMIKCSEVLTDTDLIEIVRSQCSAKQIAVAVRPRISSMVSDALVATGNEHAVARLVGNEGADLTENALSRVIDEYQESDAITDSLSRRTDLPAAISERLVQAWSERLQRYLMSKHDLDPNIASNLILQARERATITLIDYGSSDAELDFLIDQLYRKERLSASLILRALCVGDLNFFERAMSRITGLPLQNVRILIHDKGMLGLEPLYLRAKLPKSLFPAFRAAISLVVETDYDGGANDRQRYVERILERMLTRFEDSANHMARDDIEYLMVKLHQLAA